MNSIRIGNTKVFNISKLSCWPAEVPWMKSTLFEFTTIWQDDQEPLPDPKRIVNSVTFGTRFLTVRLGLIPAKTLHNCDIVSVNVNHFPCMKICDTLWKHLCMLTYIYVNMDECWLTSSMPELSFKLQMFLIIRQSQKMCFLKELL